MEFRTSDLRAGLRDVAPLYFGVVPFGLVAGVAAIEQGMTPLHAMGFSSIVFAGASQLAMIELLGSNAPLAVVVGTAVVINLRMLMYSASIATYFQPFAAHWKTVCSYLLTDQAYALSIARYGEDGETDLLAYYLGVAVSLWLVWQASTIAGTILGSGLPPEWGLQFAAPLVFLALLVPVLKDRASTTAGIVGGVVAVAALSVPFHLNLMIAAVVGVVAGLVVDRVSDR